MTTDPGLRRLRPTALTPEIKDALIAGQLGQLATLNPDGSPQVSAVWIGLDGEEIVFGHVMGGVKTRNIARDNRVALTVEASGSNPLGMTNYLIIYGHGRLVEGGTPELLQRLAQVYLGPGAMFPPMPNPPAGHVIHITPVRFGGVGPWTN